MIGKLQRLVQARDALATKGYQGKFQEHLEGVECEYALPVTTENELERVVQDFSARNLYQSP